MSTKLDKFRKKKMKMKMKMKMKKVSLNPSQIRQYNWGSKEFKMAEDLPEEVQALKGKKYWLLVEMTAMTKVVSNVSIVTRELLESQRLIPLIQYIHMGSNSTKILKIAKKRLEEQLEQSENKVIFE